ncbi:MAG TPA: NAD(P)-dependent oxidoreductase [Pyrinomonadaceae bacterium]|nr:NAD(P)-dependent oxidoreductase [Pyrinomonadaceae bacterium]
MTDRDHNCAVTGATGYLGSKLESYLTAKGLTVYKLSRNARPEIDPLAVPFSLDKGAPVGFFQEHHVNTLIHCAYDFRPDKWSEIYEINVKGSIQLMAQARAEGVKNIIFISSVSAYDGCQSLYGKAKLEIEREAFKIGAVVIRPGLIYGDNPGAMMGALTNVIKRTSVVPIIGSGKQVLYLVHEDDLASLIYKLSTEDFPQINEPITAASEHGHTFSGILKILAERQGKTIRIVPMPWKLCWAGLRVLELFRIKLGFRSDSIVSLVNTNPDMRFDWTKRTGIRFREFSSKT